IADILKKFDFWSIRIATTPIESNKPLVKDEDGEDVDVYVYSSMIGSLMYLTASRLDIMLVVCACARFQVTSKASHLNEVKRIFRFWWESMEGQYPVTTQAAQIKDLKAQIKQLKKKAKPVISHHNAWIKSVSMKKRLARKKSLKTKLMQKSLYPNRGGNLPTSNNQCIKIKLMMILMMQWISWSLKDAHNEGGQLTKGQESSTEKAKSEGVNEAERKFSQLANDEEIARKTDLAEKLKKKREIKFTLRQRAKFLHDTIIAQRRFLAQQRSEAIKNKLPIRNQLRNQMMT
ncbi:hypothetical protein Tco_1132217, partial [Tanacetum coccineum]